MRNFFVLRIHRFVLISTLVISTIGCDQVTKIAARDTLKDAQSISYLNNTFRLEYAENSGAFLSLGANLPEPARFWIFSALVSAFLIGVAYQLFRSKFNFVTTLSLSLVLGGGIGNLIDRLLHGQVIDFLNFGFGTLRTGIFNVADIAIVLGVLALALEPILHRRFKNN